MNNKPYSINEDFISSEYNKRTDKRHFLTVEYCNNGKRGIFVYKDGSNYSSKKKLTDSYMDKILGPFRLILNPKSMPLSEDELKQFNIFRPLAEYMKQYGIAVKPDNKNIKGNGKK